MKRVFTKYITPIFLFLSTTALADINFNPLGTSWNGKKVYISIASHPNAGNGSRGECLTWYNFYNNGGPQAYKRNWYIPQENALAQRYSIAAANGNHINGVSNSTNKNRNLRRRGYVVRLGTGSFTQNWKSSNQWNAGVHIPIHSNAIDGTPYPCNTNRNQNHGTWLMWDDAAGKKLGSKIYYQYKDLSPGTNDKLCEDQVCGYVNDFYDELRYSNAPAAYFEREFHTWDKGILFLGESGSRIHSWKLGNALDQFFGI